MRCSHRRASAVPRTHTSTSRARVRQQASAPIPRGGGPSSAARSTQWQVFGLTGRRVVRTYWPSLPGAYPSAS
ncbi:hypothetical protein Rrhod_3289 [Rhodococcus rhodnii LMG 5362]|uniref:Uncharacterized protein n=1 Tax=Rhodococcus rhodnii LMG 5362 TaxID=1273125 RepID=R7WJK6_9NOCA|nr:hypothetical protein Rrhod_3289 [Rhodococcus rhodnii LMG 5362]